MPAKDSYHDAVVNALKKDGWTITKEQVRLIVENRWMWVDIQARRNDDRRTVLIEVKGFENIPSPIAYLQAVIGQYVVYQVALEYLEWEYPLYLAVPDDTLNGILGEEIGQLVIKKVNLKFLIFSIDNEEVIQWSD